MTEAQKTLMYHCRIYGSLTKAQAVNLIGYKYFHNKSKHTGDVLSRMVKAGLLKRVKTGLFELGDRINKNPISDNQLNLFNE